MSHLTTISRRITWLPAFMALLPKGTMLEGEDWRRRHQGILFLLWLHAAAIPWFGVLAGNTPSRSLTGGFIVAALSAWATWAPFANRWRGVLTTVGLMVSSTVLVPPVRRIHRNAFSLLRHDGRDRALPGLGHVPRRGGLHRHGPWSAGDTGSQQSL